MHKYDQNQAEQDIRYFDAVWWPARNKLFKQNESLDNDQVIEVLEQIRKDGGDDIRIARFGAYSNHFNNSDDPMRRTLRRYLVFNS